MNTKLTLTIDKDLIIKAKEVAKSQNLSLSGIIENYLKTITYNKSDHKVGNTVEELAPITKSLLGIFKDIDNVDYKEERMKRLEEKYL